MTEINLFKADTLSRPGFNSVLTLYVLGHMALSGLRCRVSGFVSVAARVAVGFRPAATHAKTGRTKTRTRHLEPESAERSPTLDETVVPNNF